MKTPIQIIRILIENKVPLSDAYLDSITKKEEQMIAMLKKKKMYSQLQDIEEDYKCSCCGHSEFEIKND